jgi:predicted TIM-barrel fold metal-dependent hydrolase
VRSKDDPACADRDDLLTLARFPNIAVKASSAPSYSTQSYPWRNVHQPIRRIFDAFGPTRSFWGTGITRMPYSYRPDVH